MSTILKKVFKSLFPALNTEHRSERVTTDAAYSNTWAIHDSSTCAQIFVRTKTLVTNAYSMKSEKQFIITLEENTRKKGAIDKLNSD